MLTYFTFLFSLLSPLFFHSTLFAVISEFSFPKSNVVPFLHYYSHYNEPSFLLLVLLFNYHILTKSCLINNNNNLYPFIIHAPFLFSLIRWDKDRVITYNSEDNVGGNLNPRHVILIGDGDDMHGSVDKIRDSPLRVGENVVVGFNLFFKLMFFGVL